MLHDSLAKVEQLQTRKEISSSDARTGQLDEARIMGLERFKQEHPGRSLSLIHGKAMQA